MTTGADVSTVWVAVRPVPDGVDVVLARRLLEVQGARVEPADGALRVALPRA